MSLFNGWCFTSQTEDEPDPDGGPPPQPETTEEPEPIVDVVVYKEEITIVDPVRRFDCRKYSQCLHTAAIDNQETWDCADHCYVKKSRAEQAEDKELLMDSVLCILQSGLVRNGPWPRGIYRWGYMRRQCRIDDDDEVIPLDAKVAGDFELIDRMERQRERYRELRQDFWPIRKRILRQRKRLAARKLEVDDD